MINMASGNRLFLDSTAALRNVAYPGSFSAELMFRSHTNPFSHVQFIPERVVEFSISPEGMRFYKVQWQETWLPEHHLIHYQNLIEIFWRNQNELTNNNQSTNNKPNNTSNEGNTIKDSNPGQCFLTALQSDHVDLEATTLPGVPLLLEKTLEKQTIPDLDSMKQHLFDQNSSNNNNLVNKANHDMGEPLQLPNTKIDIPLPLQQQQVQHQESETNYDLGQTEQHLVDKPVNGENPLREKPNELSKVISQVKKNKAMSLQLEGFELVNIENSSATEAELKVHAIEVLCSFTKKRVRCPNGSSQLPHTCFFCTKVLSSRKKLREHQFSIHLKNVGEFVCGICQQRFAFRRKLKAHIITHSDDRNFVCKICGLTCKRRTHLHTHMQTHEKERNYRCDVCHKNFKVQADLKNHCLNEHKNQVSKCNVCKHTLQTAFSVYIHSMRHSGTRDHTCQICRASFKSKHHLTAHQKTHENQTENIKCPACDKEFPDKKYFRKHLELVHKDLAQHYRYDYICTICDKDFAYKGRLDEHMKTHAEETEEERNVRVKNARRKKVESLSDEAIEELSDKVEKVVNKETGEIKLKCKLCHRREFRLISTMEKHLEDHKTGNKFTEKESKTFECTVCKKTFQSEARLLRHNVVHQSVSKANQFQCRICKGNFKWKSCLQTHMKKCNPTSKGAGKRKATLKAKEKLQKQSEEVSSPDETSLLNKKSIAADKLEMVSYSTSKDTECDGQVSENNTIDNSMNSQNQVPAS